MLVSHFVSIVTQLVKGLRAYLLIADVNAAAESRKIDVYPVWILRPVFKKGSVFYNAGVHRVFKSVRIAGLIEHLVPMLRQRDLKIRTWPGHIIAVTGGE